MKRHLFVFAALAMSLLVLKETPAAPASSFDIPALR